VTKKQWTEIRINLAGSYQDLLIGQLAAQGLQGFLQEEKFFSCYLPRKSWTTKAKKSLTETIRNFKNEFPDTDCSWKTSVINYRNWNAEWEKSVGIVEATSRIIIKPTWKKIRKRDKGKIVLHIDPKMAFGTGHHETTRLCLVLLEEHMRRDAAVLDFGTGTGVLAIAAIKLGARSAFAIDNDPLAVENAGENVRKNRVEDAVKLRLGDVSKLPAKQFDLITANIDLPTITVSLKGLLPHLKEGGTLIVSGLLVTDLSRFLDRAPGNHQRKRMVIRLPYESRCG
jgi:ribosomal protein L11 methyltransferase